MGRCVDCERVPTGIMQFAQTRTLVAAMQLLHASGVSVVQFGILMSDSL
jgi:hypothetical protein